MGMRRMKTIKKRASVKRASAGGGKKSAPKLDKPKKAGKADNNSGKGALASTSFADLQMDNEQVCGPS